MARKAEVTMVNPSPRGKKGKKKSMAKKRKKTGSRKRKGGGSRSRRRNPSPRRRRRASSPKRRRRRSNPSSRYRRLDFMEPMNDIIWRMAGMAAVAFGIQRFAPQQGAQSLTAGSQITFRGYMVGLLSGYIGAEMVARWQGNEAGREMWRGAVDFLAFKFLWTEGISRSQWLTWAFGNTGNGAGLYSAAIQTGPDGTVWMQQPDGSYISMQGYQTSAMGTVVPEDRLGTVVPEDRLGAVVPADRLGLMDPDLSDAANTWNIYQDAGGRDPYVAAYATV